jgi:outer membrane protein assembly factor BamB
MADSGLCFPTGSFTNNLTYNGIATSQTNAGGSSDYFFTKIDTSTGALVWASTFGGNASESGGAIVVDGSGKVYGAVYVPQGTCIVGGNTLKVTSPAISC